MYRFKTCSFFVLLAASISASHAADILVLGLFKDMVIFKLDETRYKLRTGESTPEGIRLIASDSEKAILEINGVQKTFTLGAHHSAQSFETKRTSSEAKIWANRGMYLTTGLINGQPAKMLIDTGASSVAMGMEHARQLGINYRYIGRPSSARTASGVVRTWEFKLKSIKIGDIELKDIDAAVVEGTGPSTILLGMSFLKHVKMQREGNLLQLQRLH